MSCRICYIVVIYLQLDLDIIKLYSICTTCQLPTHNGHYVIIFTLLIITNKYAVKLYYKDKQHIIWGLPECSPHFSGVRDTRSLVLYVCFVDRCLSFWPLCCLFFFDIQILITPLVSSKLFF